MKKDPLKNIPELDPNDPNYPFHVLVEEFRHGVCQLALEISKSSAAFDRVPGDMQVGALVYGLVCGVLSVGMAGRSPEDRATFIKMMQSAIEPASKEAARFADAAEALFAADGG